MTVMFPLTDALAEGGGGGADLGDVISSTLEGVAGRTDEVVADPVADLAVEQKEPTAEEKEEQELKALEADILAKNPAMKGQIAVHRHQAVLTRARNEHTKALEEREAKLKQLQWANDPDIRQALTALALAETDQKAFVELLMKDERFANLIDFKKAQEESQVTAQPNAGRPGPNKVSEDGSYKYYDEEGLGKLMEWERLKAVEQAKAEFTKEFGPVKQEFEQRNAWNQSLETQRKVLDNARTNWKGFKDNEPAIKEALIKNESWSLDDAYRAVVIEKFAADTKTTREKLRAELLAEINGKKAAAAGVKPGGGVEREVDPSKQVDMEDVIRRSLPQDR